MGSYEYSTGARHVSRNKKGAVMGEERYHSGPVRPNGFFLTLLTILFNIV